MKIYYAYLKTGLERTGDFYICSGRKAAAEYFANKKRIALKDWLKSYTVFDEKHVATLNHMYVKLIKDSDDVMYYYINDIKVSAIKWSGSCSDIVHKKCTLHRFLEYIDYLKKDKWSMVISKSRQM